MKNGDKISGKIVALAGGKLMIETPHSGIITVEWSQVASLKSDIPIKVKSATGEVFEGKVTSGPDGRLKVESSPGVTHDIAPDQVKALNEPPVAWHGSLDLAARKTDGNTHNSSMLLNFDALRAGEHDRIILKALYRYTESSDVVTERNAYAQGKYDYLFTETWYAYGSLEFMADKFRDLRSRWIASAGIGHIFIKKPEMDLWGDAGLAYTDNDYREADDDSYPGARFSAHFRRLLPLNLEFVDDFVILPNFEEGDNWLARNEMSVSTNLFSGWGLKVGWITDYDNDPSDGVRKYDDTYYLALGYKF
jgi:putative salt-induced outer membrane protein YdiY